MRVVWTEPAVDDLVGIGGAIERDFKVHDVRMAPRPRYASSMFAINHEREYSVNPFGGDPRQFIWRVNQVDRLTGAPPPDLVPFSPSLPAALRRAEKGKREESQTTIPLAK